jgi:hypothetical protein
MWVINIRNVTLFLKKHKVDFFLILSLFILAFSIYLYKIDIITPGVQGDELAIARASEEILTSSNFVPFLPVNYGHPTPLLYVTGISMQLFGNTVAALRLPYLIFGALSIGAFYILLRLFFTRKTSFLVSLLMLFSYPFIIISRLAYEGTPSIFFQILTVIFLCLAWKYKDIRYYAAVGLTLGAGFYTYVGFRSFAFLALLISLFLLSKTKTALHNKIQFGYTLLIILFITVAPLLAYSFSHMNDLMARMNSLSIFHQNLPQGELTKELGTNIFRLSHIFFFNGDPNFKNNPSAVSLFDKGTFLLFVAGLIAFFRRRRKLFFLMLLFTIPPIINDIFVFEPIPEAHYHGIGHPNTLRIAGMIPIIFFCIASIAYASEMTKINQWFKSINKKYISAAIYTTVGIIIILNLNYYYNQPLSGYVYLNNGAPTMNVVKEINEAKVVEVSVAPEFLNDDRLKFFVKKNVLLKPFTAKSVMEASNDILNNQMTVTTYNEELYKTFSAYAQQVGIEVKPLVNPVNNRIDALIFIKKKTDLLTH